MQFDHSKLRGRIIEKYGSCAAFAAAIGMPPATLSSRLNNKTYFSMPEMDAICAPGCLDIAAEDIPSYFLARKFD